ncbi:MAG: glycerol-3-phosphate acyltransferase [Actinomycetota bacterium]
MAVVLLVPVAWALGTFPTAVTVARARGRDVLGEGSGNPGASNIGRLLGWRWGILVLAVDFAKGAVAAGVGFAIDGRTAGLVLGSAAVLGHTFPIVRKGGKGVATAGGALTVCYPAISAVLAVVWFVVARVLRKSSLASLTITVAFPLLVLVTGPATGEIAIIVALAALIIFLHRGNISRLVRGEEHDIGGRPS